MATIISCLWPIALLVVAWLIYQRISSDQPREVVAPFALTFAWILVAPWVFAWYTAVAWAALTQVPRNRMTRWLTIVTVFLALCLSSGGQAVHRGTMRQVTTPVTEQRSRRGRAGPAWPDGTVAGGRGRRCGGTGWPPCCWRPAWCCGCWSSSPTGPRCSTSTRPGTCTTPSGMDPVGYKGPLRAILFVANFDAVAAVQHLLGLAMAVLIYLLLLRRGVSRWLAALAIAPVLLDAYQLQIEQTIMPDVWFEALIVAGLAILLWPPAGPAGGACWRPAWCWAPRPPSPRSARP